MQIIFKICPLGCFQAAYRDNTLGLPKFCPPENVKVLDKATLYRYMQSFHTPNRMVLAGVGMEHQALVDMATDIFCSKTPTWEESAVLKPPERDNSLAQYTGGILQVKPIHL